MAFYSIPSGPVRSAGPKRSPRTTGSSLSERLTFFVSTGLLCSIALTIWAFAVHRATEGAALDRLGVSFAQLTLVYFAAGPVGGLICAFVAPLHRWIVGAFAVGVVTLFPLYFFSGLALSGLHEWPFALAISVIPSLIVGGSAGVSAWLDDHPKGPTWIDALRYPTRETVELLWLVAGILSILAWVIGLKWRGEWPAIIGLVLFLVPIGFAVGVTIVHDRAISTRD